MPVSHQYYELWDTPPPTVNEFFQLNTADRLRLLCLFGHLAPSSHNTQPWRFQIDQEQNRIKVFLDRSRVLPESDVVGRQAIISIGCAIENIVLAASLLAHRADVLVLDLDNKIFTPKKVEFEPTLIEIACINITPSDEVKNVDMPLAAILSRKSFRSEFDPKHHIPQETLTKLAQNAALFKGVKLHQVTDTLHRLAISEFQGQADGFVLNSPRFACELGTWLYSNDDERPDGMPGNTFGFDDAQSKRIQDGLLGKAKLEPEDSLRFSLGGKIGFEKSPLICFITAERDDVQHRIAAGRLLERSWLFLEAQGISVAMHAAIVEVRLINRIFATTLGTTEPLAVVFRSGWALNPSERDQRPHSPRSLLEDVLI
jgi:hypothetical protein